MKKLTHKIILLLLNSSLILSGAAIAAENDATPVEPQVGTAQNSEGEYVPPDMELVQDYCPPVESLVRNPTKQSWAAPNGWKTTTPSFLHTLDAFAGAEWVGVSVGEIICVYIKTTRNSFPVTLQRSKLVPAPKVGGLWSADKGGYTECKSNDVKDCPFFVQVPKKPKDIYEQLDFYKGKPTENN